MSLNDPSGHDALGDAWNWLQGNWPAVVVVGAAVGIAACVIIEPCGAAVGTALGIIGAGDAAGVADEEGPGVVNSLASHTSDLQGTVWHFEPSEEVVQTLDRSFPEVVTQGELAEDTSVEFRWVDVSKPNLWRGAFVTPEDFSNPTNAIKTLDLPNRVDAVVSAIITKGSYVYMAETSGGGGRFGCTMVTSSLWLRGQWVKVQMKGGPTERSFRQLNRAIHFTKSCGSYRIRRFPGVSCLFSRPLLA